MPNTGPDEVRMRLIPVTPNEASALTLYALLKTRTQNISHSTMPTFEEHREFVFSHPYRAWHLIEVDSECIGAIYVLESNNIGVHTRPGDEHHIAEAIRLVFALYEPLPAIKSVRAPFFSINVAPTNTMLGKIIEDLGGELAQVTYVIRQLD
jgi:hypothetical protein